MAKPLPDFIDIHLIERILKENLKECPVRIDEFTGTPATKPGDNYSSDVFTIIVRYNGDQEVHLLAKIILNVGFVRAFTENLAMFEKEVHTFRELLPKFSSIMSVATGTAIQFGARCYYANREPLETIVFEDLKALGYRLPDLATYGGMDYEHCDIILRKVGLFHAASMVYAAKGPPEVREVLASRYSHGLVRPGDDAKRNPALEMFQNGLAMFLKVSAKWPEMDREIWRKLDALQPRFTQLIIDCYTVGAPLPPGYQVLNHGDLWGSNMMFRYNDDNGTVQDVIFVDYQLSKYGSPGTDLVYCLYNCPQFEVREHRMEDLLQVYHRSLCDGLRKANYHQEIPTFDDVQREFARHEFIGLLSGLSMLQAFLMERNDEVTISFDNMLDENHAERILQLQYNGKRYRQAVIPILERYNAKGFLD